MTDDTRGRRTIGVTSAADAVLEQMIEQGHFSDGIDAAKFALGLAVHQGDGDGVEDTRVEGTNTKWNVGSFDHDGRLRSLIATLYGSDSDATGLIEFLIDAGLTRISQHIAEAGELDVVVLLDEAAPQSSTD